MNEGKGYDYIGVYLDSQLNLHYQFDRLVKRIFSRITLLARIQPLTTPVAADRIYKSMIDPIFHYCYPIYVILSSTQNDKLNSLQDQAKRLSGSSTAQLQSDSVNQRNWVVDIDVFKLFQQPGHLPPNKYKRINHNINTRCNKSLLCLPKVKTEMFKKSVHYHGDTILNKLPRELKCL